MLREPTPTPSASPVANPGRGALARAFTALLDEASRHGEGTPYARLSTAPKASL
jgi:hypothetical protein